MSERKLTPRQESRVRMAALKLAVLTLHEWQCATRGEQRVVLAEMLADDLRRPHRPKKHLDEN